MTKTKSDNPMAKVFLILMMAIYYKWIRRSNKNETTDNFDSPQVIFQDNWTESIKNWAKTEESCIPACTFILNLRAWNVERKEQIFCFLNVRSASVYTFYIDRDCSELSDEEQRFVEACIFIWRILPQHYNPTLCEYKLTPQNFTLQN